MNAELRAEFIREKLKTEWPGLNGCDSLECLIEKPELLYYESLKIPVMSAKVGFFARIFSKLRSLFRGK